MKKDFAVPLLLATVVWSIGGACDSDSLDEEDGGDADSGGDGDSDGDGDTDSDVDSDGDGTITLEMSPDNALENAGRIHDAGLIALSPTPASDVIVSVRSSAKNQLVVEETRVVAAGSSSEAFWVEPVDDTAADGDRTVTIEASAPGYRTASVDFTVVDDDGGLGILEIDPDNPRYLRESSAGKTVHLSGPHTWWNVQDIDTQYPPAEFDFEKHVNWLREKGYNYTRLWHFESVYWYSGGTTKQYVHPNVYQRAGPELANDGRPKFDVTKLNQDYFDRLRERVEMARDNEIYVSVMFFQGIASTDRAIEWEGHPFHVDNNINGINGDLNGNGAGSEVHTLLNSDVVEAQRLHIRRAIDTLNDLDNVMWEIGNEIYPGPDQVEWAYSTIDFVREYESSLPKQHLIGLSYMHSYNDGGVWTRAGKAVMFDSPADWISVGWQENWEDYRYDPPPATGEKVIFSDVDHLWGTFADGDIVDARNWLWKSVTRALYPINMEYCEPSDYPAAASRVDGRSQVNETIRVAMSFSLDILERFELSDMRPRSDVSGLTHCLAEEGRQYLIYKPDANTEPFTVRGLISNAEYEYEWFDAVTNESSESGSVVPTESSHSFNPPTGYALLYLKLIEG